MSIFQGPIYSVYVFQADIGKAIFNFLDVQLANHLHACTLLMSIPTIASSLIVTTSTVSGITSIISAGLQDPPMNYITTHICYHVDRAIKQNFCESRLVTGEGPN